jgi:hypothetical protein
MQPSQLRWMNALMAPRPVSRHRRGPLSAMLGQDGAVARLELPYTVGTEAARPDPQALTIEIACPASRSHEAETPGGHATTKSVPCWRAAGGRGRAQVGRGLSASLFGLVLRRSLQQRPDFLNHRGIARGITATPASATARPGLHWDWGARRRPHRQRPLAETQARR